MGEAVASTVGSSGVYQRIDHLRDSVRLADQAACNKKDDRVLSRDPYKIFDPFINSSPKSAEDLFRKHQQKAIYDLVKRKIESISALAELAGYFDFPTFDTYVIVEPRVGKYETYTYKPRDGDSCGDWETTDDGNCRRLIPHFDQPIEPRMLDGKLIFSLPDCVIKDFTRDGETIVADVHSLRIEMRNHAKEFVNRIESCVEAYLDPMISRVIAAEYYVQHLIISGETPDGSAEILKAYEDLRLPHTSFHVFDIKDGNTVWRSDSASDWTFDSSSGMVYRINLYGDVLESFSAVSGPYGNGELPQGTYRIQKPAFGTPRSADQYCDKSKNCWFQPMFPEMSTPRTGIAIHPDGNVPGTKGCIGIAPGDTSDLLQALKDSCPGTVTVY